MGITIHLFNNKASIVILGCYIPSQILLFLLNSIAYKWRHMSIATKVELASLKELVLMSTSKFEYGSLISLMLSVILFHIAFSCILPMKMLSLLSIKERSVQISITYSRNLSQDCESKIIIFITKLLSTHQINMNIKSYKQKWKLITDIKLCRSQDCQRGRERERENFRYRDIYTYIYIYIYIYRERERERVCVCCGEKEKEKTKNIDVDEPLKNYSEEKYWYEMFFYLWNFWMKTILYTFCIFRYKRRIF